MIRTLLALTLMAALLPLTACRHHHHQDSPGQVMQDTGYNPASGKMHPHGGPPGQNK